MKADEKQCPRCAETIKLKALVCRHCLHEFPASEVAAQVEKAATKNRNRAIDKALRQISFADTAEELAGMTLTPGEAEEIADNASVTREEVIARAEHLKMIYDDDDGDGSDKNGIEGHAYTSTPSYADESDVLSSETTSGSKVWLLAPFAAAMVPSSMLGTGLPGYLVISGIMLLAFYFLITTLVQSAPTSMAAATAKSLSRAVHHEGFGKSIKLLLFLVGFMWLVVVIQQEPDYRSPEKRQLERYCTSQGVTC